MNSKNRQTDPKSGLYQAFLTLRTPQECFDFLQDLCTVAEQTAMEQRFEVAKLLREGRIYQEILEMTGASSATISRVNRALHYGAEGYGTVLERLEKEKP